MNCLCRDGVIALKVIKVGEPIEIVYMYRKVTHIHFLFLLNYFYKKKDVRYIELIDNCYYIAQSFSFTFHNKKFFIHIAFDVQFPRSEWS